MSLNLENRGPGAFKEYLDGSPGPRWKTWKRDFELIMKANKIEGNDRAVWLLALGGPDIQRLNEFLPKENEKVTTGDGAYVLVETAKGEYERLIDRLDTYFLPKVLFVLQRAKFRELEQSPHERIDSFILRLREQGTHCNYGEKLDIMIIDQILEKSRSEKLKSRLREKDYELVEVQALAAALELQESDGGVSKINRVEFKGSSHYGGDRTKRNDNRTCYNCGRKGHISTSDICPAKGRKCHKCGGIGHFEKQCRKRKPTDSESHKYPKKMKAENEVNSISVQHTSNSSVNVQPRPDIYEIFFSGESGADIDCILGGVQYKMLIDSGADLNIIGYDQWLGLKKDNVKIWNPVAGSNGKILKAYATEKPMEIIGSFMANVQVGSKEVSAQFFVVKNGNRALLSRTTSQELGILKLGYQVNNLSQFNKIKGN